MFSEHGQDTFCGVSLDRIYGYIGSFTAKSRMREIMDSFVKRSVSSSGEVILSFLFSDMFQNGFALYECGRKLPA